MTSFMLVVDKKLRSFHQEKYKNLKIWRTKRDFKILNFCGLSNRKRNEKLQAPPFNFAIMILAIKIFLCYYVVFDLMIMIMFSKCHCFAFSISYFNF